MTSFKNRCEIDGTCFGGRSWSNGLALNVWDGEKEEEEDNRREY